MMRKKKDGDLINRNGLLDTILDHFGMDLAYYGRDLQFVQEAIENAPAVDIAGRILEELQRAIDQSNGIVKATLINVAEMVRRVAGEV